MFEALPAALIGAALISPPATTSTTSLTAARPIVEPMAARSPSQSPVPAAAASPPAVFKPLPLDEDWSGFADQTGSPWRTFKHVSLGSAAWASFGGEFRTRYEFRENDRFGAGVQDDDGDLQLRLRLWSDLRLSRNLRAFVELKTGETQGLASGTSPVDDYRPELAQAFVELSAPIGADGSGALRIGRQEIAFGSLRLFDVRDAPNSRRSFDAVRLMGRMGRWDATVMVAQPLLDSASAFDDEANDGYDVTAAGIGRALAGGGRLEAAYVASDRASAAFDSGVARDDRRTYALRLAGERGRLKYDIEGVGQDGDFGDEEIAAWMVSVNGSWGLDGAWKPRLGARYEAASGDDAPNDGELNTYGQLFAQGLTINGEIGRANIRTAELTLAAKPSPKLSLDATFGGMWRESTADGIYNVAGALVRPGGLSDADEIGWRATLWARYQLTPHVQLSGYLNQIQAGDYLRESGGDNLFYATTYVTLKF